MRTIKEEKNSYLQVVLKLLLMKNYGYCLKLPANRILWYISNCMPWLWVTGGLEIECHQLSFGWDIDGLVIACHQLSSLWVTG